MAPLTDITKILQAAKDDDVQLLESVKSYNNIADWSVCRHMKSGDGPLHIAAKHGNVQIVRFLVENWFVENCLSITNKNGKTALHEAAQNTEPDIVNYLIEYGAEVNCIKGADWTPLMLACTKSGIQALETVTILLKNGADPKLCNKDGWTALHIAARDSDVAVVGALLSADSSLARKKSNNGRLPLHTAALHGKQDVAKMLIASSPKTVNAVDFCGSTPLLDSIRNGTVEFVQYLVNQGASLKHCDAMGLGAPHIAAQTGYLDVIGFLMHACNGGVNVKSEETGFTPLHCAARSGQVDALKLLLSMGGNPFLQDKCGRTVSDIAVLTNKQDIVMFLQEYCKSCCSSP